MEISIKPLIIMPMGIISILRLSTTGLPIPIRINILMIKRLMIIRLLPMHQSMDKITMANRGQIMLITTMDRIIMMLNPLIQLMSKHKPTLITLITTTINKLIP